MRVLSTALALAGTLCSVEATTLRLLTTDEMILQSTAIVRAKVVGSRSAFRGADIFTYYQLQVVESWKLSGAQQVEVAVPGGAAQGLRQTVVGAPQLNLGSEYVIFLWTSRAGLTQIIGLSQGLFLTAQNTAGGIVLIRPSSSDLILDKSGNVVNESGMTLNLADLRSRIQQLLGAGK